MMDAPATASPPRNHFLKAEERTLDTQGYEPEWFYHLLRRLLLSTDRAMKDRMRPHLAAMVRERLAHLCEQPTNEALARAAETIGRSLETEGVALLQNLLPPEDTARILEGLKGKPMVAPRCAEVLRFGVDEQGAMAQYSITNGDLITVPEIAKLANHPLVLAAVERHLGAVPTLSLIEAGVARHEGKNEGWSQGFHVDTGLLSFVKLFFYLSDVDADSGAHEYVRQTHRADSLARTLARLYKANPDHHRRATAATREMRMLDRHIYEVFPDTVVVLEGKAGTAILEDTGGYHRGRSPRTGTRIMLTITYTLDPILDQPYAPVPYAELPEACRQALKDFPDSERRRHINRLFISP